MNADSGRVLGIDLGTTYTAVAYVDEYGIPVVIKNSDGRSTTPSAVFFDPPNYVVGDTAIQSTLTEPERVVQFVKRFMGVRDHRVRVVGESYSPEFVSSLILRKVVQEAEDALGEPVTGVVITVPAYFGEAQRHATYEAAQLAGLKVLRIINEPTAAALSYGIANRGAGRRNILVYDLGGGTFDVTILRVSRDSLDVLGVGGDPALGGKDFDDTLMNFIEERIVEQLGCNIEMDQATEAEFRFKAEAAKRQLSGRTSVPITLKVKKEGVEGNNVGSLAPVRVEVTRDEFEIACADLLTRTELMLDVVLRRADLQWEDISEILCVGGSSRMPMVREMLTRVSGKKPLLHDPDECVAKGAAIQAAMIAKEPIQDVEGTVRIGHVLPHSLGVAAVINGIQFVDHVIPSLTPLPCSQVRNGYTTVIDNQKAVEVRIFEGESADIESYSGPIGTIELDMTPPRPAGHPNISVEFRCDENARITAIARDRDTGHESRTFLTISGARTDDESQRETELLAEAIIS